MVGVEDEALSRTFCFSKTPVHCVMESDGFSHSPKYLFFLLCLYVAYLFVEFHFIYQSLSRIESSRLKT